MDSARIAALLQPFLNGPLPESTLAQISIYIDLLLRWNARINLTAVRDEEHIVTRHFGESLFLARHLFPVQGRAPLPQVEGRLPAAPTDLAEARALDIGSGAGFPALPLKLWAPTIQLVMVESNHKKATFLREVARSLTLTDINVMTERAEALADRLGPAFPPFDLVTFRAVERFEAVLPLAERFLALHGRLAVLVGSSQALALPSLLPGLRWLSPIPLPESESRVAAIASS
jgi:16S rRNA (guanine527-N7)-methyltransferase